MGAAGDAARRALRAVRDRTGSAECEAVGYPRVVAEPEQRDTHHAVGLISPRSLLKAGLYAMEVANPPTAGSSDPDAGPNWAGMSGAGVEVAGHLVGIVTTDPEGFDSRRLVLTPVARFVSDPQFAASIADHVGSAPLLEPVELADLVRPAAPATSPAELLRADAATAPFRGRPELEVLTRWCDDPAGWSVRLVAGPGGQGKTRLARQLITDVTSPSADATHVDWVGLILDERAGPEAVSVIAELMVPTLIVVDYAEGRSVQLSQVFDVAQQSDAPIRVLLLARTAGAWRTDHVEPLRDMEVLADDRIVVELSVLDADRREREDAWRDAAAAFNTRLGELVDLSRTSWQGSPSMLQPPDLSDDRFRTALAVQMDALSALLRAADPADQSIADKSRLSAEDVLLIHEQRYWSRVALQHRLSLSPAVQRGLVALATLWGADEPADGRRLVATALHRTSEDDDDVQTVATWLSTVYRDGSTYWSGLQPDVLGEHFVASTFGPSTTSSDLVSATCTVASARQLERGLTVLGRAQPRRPELRDTIAGIVQSTGLPGALAAVAVAARLTEPQPMLAAVEAFADVADLGALRKLGHGMPRFSLLLARTTTHISNVLVERLRPLSLSERDAYLPDLAASVNNLAIRLGEAGRRAEGLTAAQEAVDLYRELAAGNRDAYLPDLAMSVNNLANHLAEAGRRADGLTAAQEAVDLRRELAAGNRDAYLPDLAASVNNLANRLAEAGRRAEGLAAAQEAVDLRRELAAGNRDAYLPDLAASVNNLAIRLAEAGRRADGLAAAQEAVDRYRELAAGNRDAYLPDLAASVNNLANHLAEAGRRAERLAAAQEAVDLRRELAAGNRDAYLPNLAASVNNLAVRLAEAGRRAEGLAAAQEAADLYEELAASEPDRFNEAADRCRALAAELSSRT